MNDWERFLGEVPWFLDPGATPLVGATRPWNRGPADGLPELSALLGTAAVTPVSAAGEDYELLTWGARGWLCRPPHQAGDERVPPAQRDFWAVCGGIVETYGGPESRLLDQDEVLTAEAARVRLTEVLRDYAWLWADAGLKLPIEPADYRTVAVEANGNLTVAHETDGRLLLFAPDHAFTDVTPLAGCPPYSLLTIDGVPDLTTWIEVCAKAWRS